MAGQPLPRGVGKIIAALPKQVGCFLGDWGPGI